MFRESRGLPLHYEVTVSRRVDKQRSQTLVRRIPAASFDRERDLSREDALYAAVQRLMSDEVLPADITYIMRPMRPQETQAHLRQQHNEQLKKDMETWLLGMPVVEAAAAHVAFLRTVSKEAQ